MIPGIIETHSHALGVAEAEVAQPFRNLRTIGELQEWLRKETARQPKGTWIWSPRVYPTRSASIVSRRKELDAAAPDHPVVVDAAYAFSLNTAAMQAAKITRATPNPPGGGIVKDESGEPTGCCEMFAACSRRSGPSATLSLDMLENVHRQYLAAGITSISERGAMLDGFKTYQELKAANRLRVRTTVTVRVPRPEDAAEVERFITGLPFKFGEGDEWLKAGPLKITVDGGILIGTAYMRQPYGLERVSSTRSRIRRIAGS